MTPDHSAADGHALNLQNLRNADQVSLESPTQIMYTQDVMSLAEGEETPNHMASQKNGKLTDLYYQSVKHEVAPTITPGATVFTEQSERGDIEPIQSSP